MVANIKVHPSLKFYDLNSQALRSEIISLIDGEFLQKIVPEHFEENTRSGLLNREQWRPVLGKIIPLYSGMQWHVNQSRVVDPVYQPKLLPATLDTLLSAVQSFLDQLKARSVAVHLSGGFDSTLVIGILKQLGYSPVLVGMTSERYEFRTERYIQHLLLEQSRSNGHLIDFEEHLPHSGLLKMPPSQYPDMESGDASDHAIADKCKELGVDLVLSGEGGDILLGTAVPSDPTAIDWKLQILAQDSLTDLVYGPRGLRLESFYRNEGIADAIYSLRRGQGEDYGKVWARNFFRDFIPSELSEYSYCADFWGLYIDGLHEAIPTIRKIHEAAFEVTKLPYFLNDNLEEILSQDLLRCDQRFYQKLESRITLAAWIYSVHNAINQA